MKKAVTISVSEEVLEASVEEASSITGLFGLVPANVFLIVVVIVLLTTFIILIKIKGGGEKV